MDAPIPLRKTRRKPSRASSDPALERAAAIARSECFSSLGDDEVLALLLDPEKRISVVGFARGLLDDWGGLRGVARTPPTGLGRAPGLDEDEALRIAAAIELGRRIQKDATRIHPAHPLDVDAVTRWAETRLLGLEHEEVWVLCVDARATLKSTFQVGRGGTHGCGLLTRDILVPVVREGASGFVLVHNHPSGDPTPSEEDIQLTRALGAAATTLCVPLLDHVVVAREGTRSFFSLGLL